MTTSLCDICGERGQQGKPVIRFSLVRKSQLPDGRPTSRGAGSLDLCGKCWTKYAKPGKRIKVVKGPSPLQLVESA